MYSASYTIITSPPDGGIRLRRYNCIDIKAKC